MTEDRATLQAALAEAGFASAVYYPIPLHRQKAMRGSFDARPLPVAELVSQHVLSLPMYPELTADQIERVCRVLNEAL